VKRILVYYVVFCIWGVMSIAVYRIGRSMVSETKNPGGLDRGKMID